MLCCCCKNIAHTVFVLGSPRSFEIFRTKDLLDVSDQEQQQHTMYIFCDAFDALCKSVCMWLMRLYVGGVCVGCTNKNTKNFWFVLRLLENIKFTKWHDWKRVLYDSRTIGSQFSNKKMRRNCSALMKERCLTDGVVVVVLKLYWVIIIFLLFV